MGFLNEKILGWGQKGFVRSRSELLCTPPWKSAGNHYQVLKAQAPPSLCLMADPLLDPIEGPPISFRLGGYWVVEMGQRVPGTRGAAPLHPLLISQGLSGAMSGVRNQMWGLAPSGEFPHHGAAPPHHCSHTADVRSMVQPQNATHPSLLCSHRPGTPSLSWGPS